MATTVAEMTVAELRNLIAEVVEEKLAEAVDPNEGLKLRPEFVAKVRARMAAVERGVPAEDPFRRLGL
jgi:hypothetical protein